MVEVVFNDAEVKEQLARVSQHLTDMSGLMNELGEQLVYETEQRFDQGVSPEGVSWAAKSQTTLDAYRKRGQTVDVRPLFGPNADGIALRKSIFHDYGSDYVEIGTNKIQAAVMQFGAAQGAFGANAIGKPLPWGDIPARPFIGISEQDRSNIAASVEEWLADIVQD